MDRVELLHAPPESNWSRWLVVAVPTAEAGDDSAGPRKASGWVRIFLPFGVSLQRRDKRLDGFNLGFQKHGRCR